MSCHTWDDAFAQCVAERRCVAPDGGGDDGGGSHGGADGGDAGLRGFFLDVADGQSLADGGAKLDFGSRRVGEPSEPRGIRLVNDAAAAVSFALSQPTSPHYLLDAGTCASLPSDAGAAGRLEPGATCTATVAFRPVHEVGSATGTVWATADNRQHVVELTGAVAGPAILRVSATGGTMRNAVSLDVVRDAGEARQVSVTLTNATAVVLSGVHVGPVEPLSPLTAPNPDTCKVPMLADGGTCFFVLDLDTSGAGTFVRWVRLTSFVATRDAGSMLIEVNAAVQ